MVHKISRENALTFWDKKGNPLLYVVSANENVNSEDLVKLHPTITKYLKRFKLKVDNSSEEFLEVKEVQ